MKIKDYTFRVLLALSVLFIVGIFYIILDNNNAVYGSIVDWLGQHVAFADYFRDYFYETGKLYPDYSLQLGSGVNIAQLVYYGLFRPEIMLSYVFPSISMYQWLQISSVAMVILSVEMLYHWLLKEGISLEKAFISCLFFILAGPIIFHTHRHPMFINYLPWMIFTCIGIKNYVKRRIFWQIPIGVALTILSSYIFSVSALFMCGLYAIYVVLQEMKKFNWKKLLTELLQLLFFVILGMGIASFVLIPVGISMMEQHREALQSPGLLELLKLDFGMNSILSDSYTGAAYSAGMSMMAIISLIYGIIKGNKEIRFLSVTLVIISIIPIFSYILTGLQYVRAKSLIPMIPLICLLIGQMLERIKMKKDYVLLFIITITTFVFLYTKRTGTLQKALLADTLLCLISLWLYIVMKKKYWFILCGSAIIPLLLLEPINRADHYVSKEQLSSYLNEDKKDLVKEVLDNDSSFYRFDDYNYALKTGNQVLDTRMFKTSVYSSNSNQDYVRYFYDEMAMPSRTVNRANMHVAYQPLYQSMMGVKYLLSDGRVAYGYDTIQEKNEYKILKNENVLPIAYISHDLMNEEDYNKLDYPYRTEALYQNTIVSNGKSNAKDSRIISYQPDFTVLSMEGVKCKKVKDGYQFEVKKGGGEMYLQLEEPIANQFLILDMGIKNVKNEEKESVKITINGIDNKRSNTSDFYANHRDRFRFLLSSNSPYRKLHITLSKGKYTVTDPKVYLMDSRILDERKNSIEEFEIKHNDTELLSGKMNVKEDGYFVTSLPFQKGYEVKLDNELISYEKINTAFVGFPITSGQHEVVINYKMPGKHLGIIISLLSCALMCFVQIMKVLYLNRKKLIVWK